MDIKDNIWWTRKARIQTEKRLLSNDFHAQAILLTYSFTSVAASIWNLSHENETSYFSTIFVAFSVLILLVSSFIASCSFKNRASLIKDCYELLQSLYNQATLADSDREKIAEEYKRTLGLCENHSDIDYTLAIFYEWYNTHKENRKENITKRLTPFQIVCVIYSKVKRFVFLSSAYLLPILIIALTSYFNEP